MRLEIALLSGDGVGPEVTREGLKVLRAVGRRFGHEISAKEYLIGGNAVAQRGTPLPDETVTGCLSSRAILFGGSAGGVLVKDHGLELRPEAGILSLRLRLGAFANLRPIITWEELHITSPLKAEVIKDCDILFVRELIGGIFYNLPRGIERLSDSTSRGWNTLSYSTPEISRIARIAFEAARKRKKIVTSVDKANVLEASEVWRKEVTVVASEYPDIELEHILVDTFARLLMYDPRRFDVILTENLFGDILSDEASVITGSNSMLPSASVGGQVSIYEPIHGAQSDIAGQGIANPIGMILSTALMLRYSFHLDNEAQAIEFAVGRALNRGLRTRDLALGGDYVTTSNMGDALCEIILEGIVK